MKTQDETISLTWLYVKGYTISCAARIIGRTPAHVNMVVNGKRKSAAVTAALRALPPRPLRLRERVSKR